MTDSKPRILVWFSCGAASAVASKVAVDKYGDLCEVVTCDTRNTEHPDNERFLQDVERWIGKPITQLRSSKYASTDDVFAATRYMSGSKGARCTTELKKLPRVAFQRETDTHIFGYTADEQRRADDFEKRNPELAVEWILIDEGISKEDCLKRLTSAGIALPKMYSLGFDHNNCMGCVESASPGYWNRTRKLFPDVFAGYYVNACMVGVDELHTSERVVAGDKVICDVCEEWHVVKDGVPAGVAQFISCRGKLYLIGLNNKELRRMTYFSRSKQ